MYVVQCDDKCCDGLDFEPGVLGWELPLRKCVQRAITPDKTSFVLVPLSAAWAENERWRGSLPSLSDFGPTDDTSVKCKAAWI